MNDENLTQCPHEDEKKTKLFHISTKGKESSLYINEQDYNKAINICAVAAYALKIDILTYCMMSNHVHFAVCSTSKDNVTRFIQRFKITYSRYFNAEHQSEEIFRNIEISVKEIDSIQYLRHCIAYIMRNPVEAGITGNADQYRWSSYNCYFNRFTPPAGAKPASSFPKKRLKELLGTHTDMTGSKIYISKDGNIIPETFINRKLVEKIYDNSREVMSRFIARINYAAMEYELAYSGHTFQDSEIMNIASALSQKWYNKNLSILDAKERIKMIKILKIKYKANAYQISRVLGFERKMVEDTLGGL